MTKLGAETQQREAVASGVLIEYSVSHMKYVAVLILVFGVLGFIAFRSWGISAYVGGLAESLSEESPHSKRTEDVVLSVENPIGSAIVLHGLNFDAEGMKPIARLLQNAGFNVLAPRLVGHKADPESVFSLQREAWNEQIKIWSKGLSGPLICSGYSLGGLLLLERHISQDIHCDYFLGFSPALSVHVPAWVMDTVRAVWPSRMLVPSGIPFKYRHFDFIGLMPTFSTFDILSEFDKELSIKKQLPLKGTIFIDPRDLVVNAQGVKELTQAYFPNFKFIEIQALTLDERHAYHMLIDEEHVGISQWTRMAELVREDLERLGRSRLGSVPGK